MVEIARPPVDKMCLSPYKAVRLAMSEAFLEYVNTGKNAPIMVCDRWPRDPDNPWATKTNEALMQRLTGLECGTAHIFTQYFLLKNSPELFDVIIAMGTRSDRLTPETEFHHQRGKSHYYDHEVFLVRGKEDGTWYCGSPSNYSPFGDNTMTKIFQGNDLKNVIDELKAVEGGIWPGADFILDAIGTNNHLPVLQNNGQLDYYLAYRCFYHQPEVSYRMFSKMIELKRRPMAEEENAMMISLPVFEDAK